MAIPKIETRDNPGLPDSLPNVRTYGPEHITPDGKFLQIELKHQQFNLKLTDVGTPNSPVFIAWLDTHPPDENHPNVDPELPHATAVERAHLIATLDLIHHRNISTIITPTSTKSTPAIFDTAREVSKLLGRQIGIIILPGGKDYEKVAKESAIKPIVYRNVTSPDGDKFMGIKLDDLNFLKLRYPNQGIVFVDDVFTTGGTDWAMQQVLRYVLSLSAVTFIPQVVLATESLYDDRYPAKPPEHVRSCIHLPEFVGGIPSRSK